ncbi:hypothetical protein H310_15248 [Aphanomyces invadans]|uniref:Uncharacterized protein n=1 Tax=Aphanomyces invadans TaxID=157072 RepID=A0A024T8K7_9STRA|nr:hypothetical protein H310_15248 [Aphanomyces invadans]ETV89911.1 hypothetical protein H310_15248 [Aphanomyces invadans]|eukprot:XP_008881457.1 hypothetical protein H310_15248 [Aphanomyces invadans]
MLSSFVQVNKARGGDVVVTVTDDASHLGMLGQLVRILGNTYSAALPSSSPYRGSGQRQQDELQDLYYMDIVATWFNFDSQALLKGLRRLKRGLCLSATS